MSFDDECRHGTDLDEKCISCEYLKKPACPCCGSRDRECHGYGNDSLYYYEFFQCSDCEAEWTVVHEVVEIEVTVGGKPQTDEEAA